MIRIKSSVGFLFSCLPSINKFNIIKSEFNFIQRDTLYSCHNFKWRSVLKLHVQFTTLTIVGPFPLTETLERTIILIYLLVFRDSPFDCCLPVFLVGGMPVFSDHFLGINPFTVPLTIDSYNIHRRLDFSSLGKLRSEIFFPI